MEGIIAALVNSFAFVVVAVLGVYGGKRIVGPNQEKLIQTLKDLVEASEAKITLLQTNAKIQDDKIASLDRQVTELKALTIFQAKEIERLTTLSKGG